MNALPRRFPSLEGSGRSRPGRAALPRLLLASFLALSAIVAAGACDVPIEDVDEPIDGEDGIETRAIVLDALAGTATLLEIGEEIRARVGRWQLGDAPQEIVVDGDRAFIVNSTSQTVQILDLTADPADATIDEIYTGDGTNPYSLALLGPDMLLVSLLLADELALIDLSTGAVADRLELPAGEDLRPLPEMEPRAGPQGIVVVEDGSALVVLNNMDEAWQPAGHGLVVLVDVDEGVQDIIDLGADCLVPGYIAVEDDTAYVTCGGTWGMDEGRLVLIDLHEMTVESSIHLGGMPSSMLLVEEHIVIADSSDGRLFMVNRSGGVIHDQSDPIIICPSDFEAEIYQYISALEHAPDGEILASCFSSSEVIRFAYEPGLEDEDSGARHALITGRVTTGDGAGGIALWPAGLDQ